MAMVASASICSEIVVEAWPLALVLWWTNRVLDGLDQSRAEALFRAGGGDRDRDKRASMGGAAAELADLVMLTNDNPRSESPDTILDQIESAVRFANVPALQPSQLAEASRGYVREPDRRRAIELAIAMCADNKNTAPEA